MGWTGGGGGGSPGGSPTQLQYNNSGIFGGIGGSSVSPNGSVSLGGATVTSYDAVLALTQTWNNAAVNFAGLNIYITNTASAIPSLIAQFASSAGPAICRLVGSAEAYNFGLQSGGNQFIFDDSGGVSESCFAIRGVNAWGGTAGIALPYFGSLSWTSAYADGPSDMYLTRGGPAVLQLGAADAASPIAQTLGFQNQIGTNVSGVYCPTEYIRAPLTAGPGAPQFLAFTGSFQGQPAPQTFTVTIASPGVATVAHAAGLNAVEGPFLLTTTGALPTGLSLLTTYYLSGFAGSGPYTFSFWNGDYVTGSQVNTSGSQSGTHTMSPGGRCTISNASPAVIGFLQTSGAAGQHLINTGQVVQFASSGTLPAGLSPNTNYYVISQGITSTSFSVSATLGGPPINTSSAGSGTFTVLYQNTQNQAPSIPIPDGTQTDALGLWIGPPIINQYGPGISGYMNTSFQLNTQWAGVPFNDPPVLMRLNVTDVHWQPSGNATLLNINYVYPSNTGQNATLLFAQQGVWQQIAPFPNYTMAVTNAAFVGMQLYGGGNSAASTNYLAFGPGTAATDIQIQRDAAAGALGLLNSNTPANPASLRVYNVFGSTNYERGIFDWQAASNVLTVGPRAGGSGTVRAMVVGPNSTYSRPISNGDLALWDTSGWTQIGSTNGGVVFGSSANGNSNAWLGGSFVLRSGTPMGWSSNSTDPWGGFGNPADTAFQRVAAKVISASDGGNNANGWFQWAGQARVTADVTFTSTTTLAAVTGLSVNVQAGRTYAFEAELYVTDAAAGGVQAAIAGTATATAIQYTGYTIADNAIKGKANATALGTAVGSTLTTETAGIVVCITGIITVNAAGTLLVQAAQNTSNATATTVKRGSYFIVQDMP
jgi:hypothetical protein